MLKIGKDYTRTQIRDHLGRGLQSCFLTAKKSVVGICLRKDLNPAAPYVILVGKGRLKEKAAETLNRQGSSVPVFMKKSVNRWCYAGDYRATYCSSSRSEIELHAKGSSRSDVAKVLKLAKADS